MGPDEYESQSDEALVRRFVEGDSEAFTPLVRRHEDRLFALALRMTGDRGDALDATQEAFVAAFRQARSFRGDSAFGTWLFRIAINSCTDFLRKRRRWGEPTEDLAPPETGGPSVEDTATTRLDLTAALRLLTPEYREAVVMHDIGGVPYEEIATATGTGLGTVKSRISRGRKRLAELLEQQTGDQPSKETR